MHKLVFYFKEMRLIQILTKQIETIPCFKSCHLFRHAYKLNVNSHDIPPTRFPKLPTPSQQLHTTVKTDIRFMTSLSASYSIKRTPQLQFSRQQHISSPLIMAESKKSSGTESPGKADGSGDMTQTLALDHVHSPQENDSTTKGTDPLNLKREGNDTLSCVTHLSKRAQKKLLRREKQKELRKAKRAPYFTSNSKPGFNSDIFEETDYYFENGLRKVYPYPFTFSTYSKERWYGRTILDVFTNEFRVDSPDNFKCSVSKGNMRVNGKPVGLDFILKNGDLIEHSIHRHENPVSGQPIEILEDTPEMVVINKPSSIPCHPCGKFRFNSIVFIMGKELGYANLRNIYRLDRLTSGVLIMGKTAKKTKELEDQVLHRHVNKEYVARVMGKFPEGEVECNQPMGCLSHKLTLWQVQAGGKPSKTTFKRISYNGKTSIVKCMPHTGRTHQIRVHLQFLGHPIVNDPFYNSPSWGPLRGKGGHSDVPFPELCKRIMKEHNVGMWLDGENRLFADKLSAVDSASTAVSTASSTDRLSAVDVAVSDSVEAAAAHGSSAEDSTQCADSPPPKRSKLSTVAPTPHTQSCADPGAESATPDAATSQAGTDVGFSRAENFDSDSFLAERFNFKADFSRANNAVTSSSQVVDGSSSQTKKTVDADSAQAPEATTDCDAADGETSSQSSKPSDCNGEAIMQVESVGEKKKVSPALERKGFEVERWVPDPLCESCRLKYLDPKPAELLLYLHASRYTGPTWDYSAKLPAWAHDDWQEPDEYQKYFN